MDVLTEPLTDVQVRILGVLVEKQLATPQAYPLTENALLTACNQTTNRYPVVAYDTSVLRPALIRLRERLLSRQVRRTGERAEKHAHRFDEQLGLSSVAPLAVLAVLMLRGPQTPGELRSRTQRLHPIGDAAAVDAALSELQDRGFAEPLPRRPGEKQIRWHHLLAGADADLDPDPSHHLPARVDPGPAPHPAHRAEPRAAIPGSAALEPQTATLLGLIETVAHLQARVDTLERELGIDPDQPHPVLPADPT